MSGVLQKGTSFRALARQAQHARGRLLPDMRRAVQAPAYDVGRRIKVEAGRRLPASGGYAHLIRSSLVTTVRTDTGWATVGVTVRTHARGKGRMRDLRALDQGRLRRPPWGRRWRKSWVTQKVRAGFWSDPVDDMKAKITRGMIEVQRRTVRRVAGGA